MNTLRRHPVAAFFVFAYLGSWLVWSPWWLSTSGLGWWTVTIPDGPIRLINLLGLFTGPFAAALAMAHVCDGRGGARRLLRRCVQGKTGVVWYAAALIVIPGALVAGLLLAPSVPREDGDPIVAGVLFMVFLLGGPIQEEPGWRGFALPRMQEHHHPLTAALLLGVVWTFWHAPLFLTKEWDTPRENIGDLLAYLAFVVALSVLMSWLTNGARGSVLLAILGHNAVNWALMVFPPVIGRAATAMWPVALGAVALALIVAVLTRGRLARTCPEADAPTAPEEPNDTVTT